MTEEITENFRNYLLQLGYSKSSVYMLPECMKEFASYLSAGQAGHNTIAAHNITQQHIICFIEYLQTRPHKRKEGGLSECYIYHHIYALKLFFSYLEETNQIRYNPISVMKFKRPKYKQREPLTQEEITQLFEASETITERVILHLFYSCGLRRSEAEKLKIKDIHLKSGMLYVREGKGHKRRAIPITEKVSSDFETYYLQERNKNQITARDTEAFILNRLGNKMKGEGYNKIVKEISKKSGLKRDISLHFLRHSIATHLLENGLTVEYVRDFLGHSYLEATQIYTKVHNHQLKNL